MKGEAMDDKPFVCTAKGCGAKFANSDHLNVHKLKHQLQISIGSMSGENLVDQTPTPTRFEKDVNAELFEEELSGTNPFDQDFRKAAARNVENSKLTQVTLQGTSGTSPTTVTLVPPASKKQGGPRVKYTNDTKQKISSPFTIASTSVTPVKTTSESSSADKTETVKALHPKASQPLETNVVTTVIRIPANTNIAALIANPAAKITETAMPVPGQNIPNNSSAAMLSVPTPAIVASARNVQNGNSASNTTVLAKQKLKQALEQSSRVGISSSSQLNITAHPTTYGTPDVNGDNSNGLNDVEFFNDSGSGSPNSTAPSPESQEISRRVPMKRSRRNQEDLDPDERRKKFLERNRAAASRCRQKRKIWVQQLEKKADELSIHNGQLQNEIAALRTEVAQLKALLLTHKDCPVTMQQQKALIEQVTPVTFIASSESQVGKTQSLSTSSQLKPTTTAEEVATSALTDMANRATFELESRATTATISLSDNVITTNGNVLL